jgi:hypothetical protein
MQLALTIAFIALGVIPTSLAYPGIHSRSDDGGVLIIPPPDLSNLTGLKQIPGELNASPIHIGF